MVDLWNKYFANVRWPELFMTMIIAGGAFLATKAHDTGALHFSQEDWIEAAGAALGAGAAYLRIPKGEQAKAEQEAQDRAEAEYPLNLPPKRDPALETLNALLAKGIPEGIARVWVATNLEDARLYVKGNE